MPEPTPISLEDHRKYCAGKWGYPMLVDVFCPYFMRNWEDRIKDGRPPKWKDPNLAFMRWIRESSPGHQFYNASKWEAYIELAKQKEFGERKREEPVYHPQEVHEQPKIKSVGDYAKGLELLRQARERDGV